jgi:nucleoid-associated protein YgaU
MAYSRMTSRTIFTNDLKEYQKEFFDKRGIKQTPQYKTGRFRPLTAAQVQSLNTISITWESHLRLPVLAEEIYGSPEYWWVICLFNQLPTPAHFKPGMVVYVPQPLDEVLSYYGI